MISRRSFILMQFSRITGVREELDVPAHLYDIAALKGKTSGSLEKRAHRSSSNNPDLLESFA
jgi:hypothetical protein